MIKHYDKEILLATNFKYQLIVTSNFQITIYDRPVVNQRTFYLEFFRGSI